MCARRRRDHLQLLVHDICSFVMWAFAYVISPIGAGTRGRVASREATCVSPVGRVAWSWDHHPSVTIQRVSLSGVTQLRMFHREE